jgi:hypothetical protein
MMEKESYTRTLLKMFKIEFWYIFNAVFINYFSITIVEFNMQTGRPVCMSFTLEGRGEHYVKLSMRWRRGWVRTVRVSSLSSRYNSHKAQPFDIHFDFGFCRPIPINDNLQKERLVCISFTFEGHGDHYVKLSMRWCRGWVRTTRVTSLSSR